MKRWQTGLTVGWTPDQHGGARVPFECRNVACFEQPMWRYLRWRLFHATICRLVFYAGGTSLGNRLLVASRLIWPDMKCGEWDLSGRVRYFHFEELSAGNPRWHRRYLDIDTRKVIQDDDV